MLARLGLRALGAGALLAVVAAAAAHADESPFAAIYTTEILPARGAEHVPARTSGRANWPPKRNTTR